ncbi:MAG: hypothetical protein M3362_17700, partial [Acidobacteriota bacterium]|nr:hypothetical protein [Acidobacteriota bacterium]
MNQSAQTAEMPNCFQVVRTRPALNKTSESLGCPRKQLLFPTQREGGSNMDSSAFLKEAGPKSLSIILFG